MNRLTLAIGAAIMAGASLAHADATSAARGHSAISAPAPAITKQTFSYGPHALQTVDFWAAGNADAPLIVFVHGGGWKRGDKDMMDASAKLSHWIGQGYAVASVNYRLVPDHSVEDQAEDIALALARLRQDAPRIGFDARKIVLTGHSAGAHLVALVGTDPAYLQAAGLSFADLRGVIALDGACYDVSAQISDGAPMMRSTYLQAFGQDPARQKHLSPTTHAGGANAPQWLILHVQRKDGTRQSKALAAALQQAGTPAMVQGFAGRGLRGHAAINRKLGQDDYPATQVVDAFLKRVF